MEITHAKLLEHLAHVNSPQTVATIAEQSYHRRRHDLPGEGRLP